MSESQFSNPEVLATENLEESERQLAKAQKDLNAGNITQERFDQLNELHNTAVADSARVDKEN